MKTQSDTNDDEDLEQRARAEVQAILGQSVAVRAATLAEAVAIAERLKADQNILLTINSLWAWFNALPAQEQGDIGQFRNARHLWMTAMTGRRRG